MENCQNATRAFNSEGQIVLLACGLWSCPRCAQINAFRWSERIRYGLALWRPRPAYFWTLTLPPWVVTPEVGYRVLPERWDALRNRLQYRVGRWLYAAFVEGHPHRAFIPHLHIISLSQAPERLKDLAVSSGFGHQAKEIEINGKMAASYVSKYASKQGREMPKNFRRVRVSRLWPTLPDPLYEFKVFPPKPRESLAAYIFRVADLTGVDIPTLRSRYSAASLSYISGSNDPPSGAHLDKCQIPF